MISRRGFLSLLAPAAALIVAPELLVPRKTFFLPPAGGWGTTLGVDDLKRMKFAMLRQVDLMVNPPVTYDIVTDMYKPIYLEQWGEALEKFTLPTGYTVTRRAGLPKKLLDGWS